VKLPFDDQTVPKIITADAYCSSYRRKRSHMNFFETQCTA